MWIPQTVPLISLTVISSLVVIAHGIPQEESVKDTLALFRRDETAYYVVLPKDTQNQDQATDIYTLLKGVVPDPTKIYNSTTDNGSQHWFWGVPLTSANAENIRKDPNVRIDS